MARIVLIGPGAIGGTAAGALLQAGKHNLLICANQRFDTLTVTRSDTGRGQSWPVKVVTKPAEVAPVDWVLLAVKSNQTDGTGDWLKAAVGPNTKLAILQNGVEHRARVAAFVPAGTAIVPVVVQLPAQRISPGAVTTYGQTLLIVGDDPAAREFAALFDGSSMKVQTDHDFHTREWEKLCLNAASALSTLSMNPDAVATVPGMRDVCKGIVDECTAVGRADGAKFADGFGENLVAMLAARTGSQGNSMFYDRRDGKKLEWDARNGVIARLGRKYGIATPVSDIVTALLRGLSKD